MNSKQKWYKINKEGCIINDNNLAIWPLPEKGGVYIYKTILENKEYTYIGSTINLKRRFRQHKYRVNLSKYNSSIFYRFILNQGWEQFEFKILEFVNLNTNMTMSNKRKLLFNAEQIYINNFKPNLNMNMFFNQALMYKHSKEEALNILKLLDRVRCNSHNAASINKHKIMNKERIIRQKSSKTLAKLKLHATVHKTISIYWEENKNSCACASSDTYNKLIKECKTIKEVGEFIGLSPTSVSNYIAKNKAWKNYSFKVNWHEKELPLINFPLDDENIQSLLIENRYLKKNKSFLFEVYKNDSLIYRFNSITSASKHLKIGRLTLTNYAVNNKLWKNIYRFQIIK